MSRDTENFSMYSLMSTRMSADESANRNFARASGQLRLPDTRRAAEDERADRTVRILEARAAAPDRAG